MMRPSRWGFGGWLTCLTVVGALLRLALVARQPLGYDEDFTAVVVSKPFGQMLDAIARDSAPPLFYVLEWPIAQVAHGPAALRLVPALAGTALIPLVGLLARRVAGPQSGLSAALVAAILPATLLASENARMYSLAAVFVLAATLLLWRAATEPGAGRRLWLAFGMSVALAVWTDYFAAIALLGVLVAVAWLRPGRGPLVAAAVAIAISFATLAPWLVFARAQFSHAGGAFWIPPLSLGSIAGTYGQLFAGPPIDSGVPGQDLLIGLQLVALLAASIGLALAWWRWRDSTPETRRAIVFCLVAASGIAILALISIWRPILEARYAGVTWLPIVALVGVGLASAPRAVGGVLLAAMVVPSLAIGLAPTHTETDSLLPQVEARLGPNDLVAADGNHYLAVLYDADGAVRGRLHMLATSDPPWYFGTAAYPAGAIIHAVPDEVIAAGGTIYWIADPGSPLPSRPAGYRESSRRCAIRVCLTVYSPAG